MGLETELDANEKTSWRLTKWFSCSSFQLVEGEKRAELADTGDSPASWPRQQRLEASRPRQAESQVEAGRAPW